MNNDNKLHKLSIGVITAMGLLATPQVFAQEEAEDGAEPVEKISIVGSRIRTDAFANDTPIDIISVEDAEQEGLKTLGELLRTSTAAAGSSQITAALTVGFVTDGGTGAETVGLRGLGANRTLILLNGRRAGPAGTRGAVSAFDLNSIPLAAIERVEILKDGASALYGSDAVAGVINIITKKGDDKTITVDISQPFESGGEDKRINISYGEEFAEGSFRVTADYRNTAMMSRGDRDYFNCTERLQFLEDGSRSDPIDPRTGKPHCSETGYGLWLYGGVSSAYGGSLQAAYDYDGFFAANGFESINEADVGFTTPDGWYPVSYGNDYASEGWWDLNHPYLAKQTVVPETTTTSLYATGDYNLSDSITMYGELIFSRRTTETNDYRQFWTADVGVLPATVLDGFDGNGFVFPVALTDHFSSDIEVNYTRGVAGLTGDIGFWTWDLSYQHSISDGDYNQDIIYRDSMLMAQYNAADGVSCSGEVTEFSNKTCVNIPWTDPQFLYGNRSPEQLDFLFGRDNGNTEYTQQTLEGFITGDLFTMPAGEVGAAFGFQVQRDEIDDRPGYHTLNGNSWGLSGAGITAGSQTTKAVYAEVKMPLLEGVAGAERLDLTASGRWTDYDTFGTDTTFKLGLNWEIVEGLSVRASRGTSFRAPALFELFLAEQTGFGGQLAVDPCLDYEAGFASGAISDTVYQNCIADGVPADYVQAGGSVTLVTSGGAGRLQAETSVAESVGVVWTSPEDTYAVSVDYFAIEINDEIDNLGGADIVSRCYSSIDFANEPLCDLFTRRDGSSANDYGIDQVNGGYVNIAFQEVRGVDYNFTYQDDFDWGSLRFRVEHTMQIEQYSKLFSDSPYNRRTGEQGYPKHVGVARLTYSNDDFSLTWTANYFDSTNDYEYYASETNTTTVNGNTVTFIDETPWTTYHTVSGSFEYESLDVILGVANVFDKAPPRISSSGFDLGNTVLASQYDFIGRRVFANLRYNF
ncbi:TonB-dependent receptor [uncultured Alteromonas sp.]|jgi:outer membrane receptor protein involved in Fe transport|uniref:TonB-dependent receptor domain-containing protein n=1 Tax=uncultured Alteromonas sp. TaxID=179113 RepID=UPI0025D1C683|nr:TonB-dependent receptor [uncultured Alteromonas sp.]